MANITTSDVLTEDRLRRVIEEEREYPLIFNEIFRTITMPDDYPSKTMHIPKDEAMMSEPREIAEGSEYPRTEEGEETIPVTVKKHGFEVAITWEATQFSVFDVIARQTEKAARRFNEYINRLAYNVVSDSGNQHPDSPITVADVDEASAFGYAQATYATKVMKDDQLNPDMFIANTEAEHVLLNSDNFQRASDLGDEVTREGAIGRFAGYDVMVDNSGLMPEDSPEVYLVDTSEYGYEVIKEDISTDQYEAPERDTDVWKWRTFREWLAVEPEAALKLTE